MNEASTLLADRMRRGDIFEPQCRARLILKHVTNTWAVLALIALRPGKLRFGELRRRINGVSERMLAQTLQVLEADGLLVRHSYDVVPPHVDYTLTELGQEAAERVEALTDWIEQRMPDLNGGGRSPDI
jgi:DNA-binding HxlR family transcriptional regulator